MVTWERIYPEPWNLELLPLITNKEVEMPSFAIKSRTTSPITDATVDATSREEAIQATVDAGPAGGQVEVLNAEAVPVAPVVAVAAPEGETKALPPA